MSLPWDKLCQRIEDNPQDYINVLMGTASMDFHIEIVSFAKRASVLWREHYPYVIGIYGITSNGEAFRAAVLLPEEKRTPRLLVAVVSFDVLLMKEMPIVEKDIQSVIVHLELMLQESTGTFEQSGLDKAQAILKELQS